MVGLESAFVVLFSSNLFSLDELTRFMSINPMNILVSLGFDSSNAKKNSWSISDSTFITKSFYKNSAFENYEVSIQKELNNV